MKQYDAPIKDAHSKASTLDKSIGSLTMPSEIVFDLNNDSGSYKHCNFTLEMFDLSCKEIVIAAWYALKWREKSGKNSKTTYQSFFHLKLFIVFMTEYSLHVDKPLTLSDVDRDFLEAWKGFIKREVLGRNCVTLIKSLLLEMADLGYLSRPFIMDNYPKKTHLNADKNVKPTEPYSKFVNRQITNAIRKELERIDSEAGELSSFDVAVCLFAIQQANGCDATGLREASADCLQDNPFDPSKRVLLLQKRRGDSTQISGAKYSESNTLLSQVGDNIIPIIETVKARNKAIRSELNGADKQRLFVFRWGGKAATLSIQVVFSSAKKLVEKYNIVDDDNNCVLT